MEEDKKVLKNLDESANAIRVVLDTSVLYAHVAKNDANHIAVESALGALRPYKPHLFIPSIVLLEVMSKLIRQKHTPSAASKLLKDSLSDFRQRYERRELSKDMIIDRYKEYSRASLGTLKGADFYIVVEAITIDAILLTCDAEMKTKAKRRHKKTFLLGKGDKSELPQLIKTVQGIK